MITTKIILQTLWTLIQSLPLKNRIDKPAFLNDLNLISTQ